MNRNDTRYGNCPFPYGPNYDRGISLNRVVGVADDPLGLTEGESYAAITMHKSYEEHVLAQPGVGPSLDHDGERTIYINTTLLGPSDATNALVTIRLGESFQTLGTGYITGQVAGVVNKRGLVGLFSWRKSQGTLEWFPDSALKVFDEVLTPADIDGTSWGGEDAYIAATTGAPLYYFFWNAVRGKLNGPVRRVLPEAVGGDTSSQAVKAYGVFVPTEGGVPQSPIPCFVILRDFWSSGEECTGYVSVSETELTSGETAGVNVGSAALEDSNVFGSSGGASATENQSAGSGSIAKFEYYSEFSDAATESYESGYFFNGWYDPSLGISDSGQNTNKLFLASAIELSRVFLLDGVLDFTGGTPTEPNPLYLILTPLIGQEPSANTQIEFSIGATEVTADGTACALTAVAYTGAEGSNVVYCYGTFYTSMWIIVRSIKNIEYKKLAYGTATGQLLEWDGIDWVVGAVGTTAGQALVWNATAAAWEPGEANGLPDGETAGQLLVWNAVTEMWEPGPYGTQDGQVLVWDNAADSWSAGVGMTGVDSIVLNGNGELQLVGDELYPAAGKYYGAHPITGMLGWLAGSTLDVIVSVQWNSINHTLEIKKQTVTIISAEAAQNWTVVTTAAAGAAQMNSGTTVGHTH